MKQILNLSLILMVAFWGYTQPPAPSLSDDEVITMMSRRDSIKTIHLNRRIGSPWIKPYVYYEYSVSYFGSPDMVSTYRIIQLVNRYKKKTDSRIVNLGFLLMSRGKKLTEPLFVGLAINTLSKFDECFYEKNHALSFEVGENPSVVFEVKIIKVKTNYKYQKSCSQDFQGVMDYESFSKLATAENVVVKFGPEVVKLEEKKHLKFIRGVNDLVGKY